METLLTELKDNINTWREQQLTTYWVVVSYIGAEFNRLGDHTLNIMGDDVYHQTFDGSWRKLDKGSDFWLFTVPGTFRLVSDLITKTLPEIDGTPNYLDMTYADEGYVKHLQVQLPQRDSHNLTLDVRGFGPGNHPNFTGQEG